MFIEISCALVALIGLEIVLGMDNLVLLAVLTQRLPQKEQARARRWGLSFAWVTRLLLLATAIGVTKLTAPLVTWGVYVFSVRQLFFFIGGMFLLTKATQEIRAMMVRHERQKIAKRSVRFWRVVLQVGIMDIVFSLDSVLTAVGLTDHFWIMAIAITISILAMLFASEIVSRFIEKYPTLKMLALSFLLLIGMVLVAEGFAFSIPRAYVYFAMGFSLLVEGLNIVRSMRVA